jgi:hypothetical protein
MIYHRDIGSANPGAFQEVDCPLNSFFALEF